MRQTILALAVANGALVPSAPRGRPLTLLAPVPPRPILVLREGDDEHIGDALEAKLGVDLWRCAGCEEALQRLKAAEPQAISAVFELRVDAQSMALAEGAVSSGVPLYRFQTGAAAFKRIAGVAGPRWLTPEPSFEKVAHANGLGFIGDDRYGDDDQAVDVTKLSDVELARFLGLPAPALAAERAASSAGLSPIVSELGYALGPHGQTPQGADTPHSRPRPLYIASHARTGLLLMFEQAGRM